jgi:hypothetical protein
MERLKASWEVFVGVIPGKAEPELSKQWLYTSTDYEADIAKTDDSESNFQRMMREAYEYAAKVTDPRYNNWVRVDYLWL